MRSSPFYEFNHIRNRLLRINAYKHMNMVYMAFHSKNIYIMFLTFKCS